MYSKLYEETNNIEPHIIAHRGYWNTLNSAQNSWTALELANNLGLYGSEFDVHLTADNIPVIHHDKHIYGLNIHKTPYALIQHCLLTNGEKLPKLEDFLRNSKDLKIKLILELKPHESPERDREAMKIVYNMVKTMGMEDRVEYISFSLEAGKALIQLSSKDKISYLSGDLTPRQLKDYGFTGLDYSLAKMKKHPEFFKQAKDIGISINIWTVNQPSVIKTMIERGADYITTDKPAYAKTLMVKHQ